MTERSTPARSLLVTGASTGIGRACAVALAGRGWRVHAGYRAEADGASLAAEGQALATEGGAGLHPVRLDVTDAESIHAAWQEVEARESVGLDGLINNAGIVVAGPLELLPIEEFRRQLEVNVVGALAVTQACLPALRLRRGRVVNMASISGRIAAPFLGAYATSKFGLEGMSDALRRELAPHGLWVSVIEPGAIDTPIWSKSLDAAEEMAHRADPEALARYQSQADRAREMGRSAARQAIGADHVVRAVVHALEARRPRTRYLVGRDARIGALLRALLSDRMMDRLIR